MRCSLSLNDAVPHTRQVVVGFFELARQGLVELHIVPEGAGTVAYGSCLYAVVDGRRVVYDLTDGYNYAGASNDDFDPVAFHARLDDVDYCFKRSYDRARHEGYRNGEKVRPLGLNYLVAGGTSCILLRSRDGCSDIS